jgi:molybdate transport system permease protein
MPLRKRQSEGSSPCRRVGSRRVKRFLFTSTMVGALGFSIVFVLAILGVQAGYSGLLAPFKAFAEPSIRHAVLLSLGTATLAATLALIVALPAAYLLARRQFPGSMLIDALLDIPVILSPVALGVSLLLLFRTLPGQWVETNLLRFIFEVPGIVLAQFTVALALSIRVLKSTFQGIDVSYEHVARFLGCTPWRAFRMVILPMSGRGIAAAYILAWARSVGEFGATVTLAGAVGGKTETIPVAIYLRMASADVEGAVALMLLLSFVSLAVLVGVRVVGRVP